MCKLGYLVDLFTAKAVLLPVHGALGGLALLLAGVALFSQKRRGRHSKAGMGFVFFMLLAIFVSIPVIVLSQNVFLGGLGAVALYLTISGLRLGMLRPPSHAVPFADRALVLTFMALFAVFVGFGLLVVVRGQMLGTIAAAIGWLGLKSCIDHHRFFARPEQDQKGWMIHHGSALGGAFIASVTAFTAAVVTNLLPQVPEFFVWLTPIAVLIPALNKQLKRGRA